MFLKLVSTGIGFAISKHLAQRKGIRVILGARDENRGMEAVKKLQKVGLVEYHHLDLNDTQSIEVLARDLKTKYGGIDILVNNAAIAYKGDAFGEEVARNTL